MSSEEVEHLIEPGILINTPAIPSCPSDVCTLIAKSVGREGDD